MRRLSRRWSGAFVFAFALLLCAGISAEPLAPQIARLERRIADRARDFVAHTMLGELRMREARETGKLDAYAKAEASFEKALAEFAQHTPALAGLAAVRIALHRFAEAETLARKIIAIDPRNAEAQLLLADAEIARGEVASAERVLAALPTEPAALVRRAEIARLHGDNDDAIKLGLRSADEADARGESPENRATYRVRAGELLFRTGRLQRAEEQYRLASDAWPEAFAVSEHIAELRGATENFSEASVRYEKLFAQSDRPEIAQALGDLYIFMKQPELAQPWHARALAGYLESVGRGEVQFVHHLAGFYADVDQNGTEAVKWARKDLEMRQTPAAHDALAWALYRAGAFSASRDQVNAALSSGIKDAHILAHGSFIYSAAGDLERGKELLRQAAAVNPHYNSFHVHR